MSSLEPAHNFDSGFRALKNLGAMITAISLVTGRTARVGALSFAASFVLTACVIGEPEPRTNKPIIPLASGNVWDYTDSIYDDTGSSAPARLDSLRISITGTRTVSVSGVDRTVYLWNVHEQTNNTPSPLSLWLENRANGNYTLGAQQETASFAFETLHLKYPATAGDRYPLHFLSFATADTGNGPQLIPQVDTLEAEVVSVNDTCVVPAGTFACVHYRGLRPGGFVHADSWYAPGVGWLGSETFRDVVDPSTTTGMRTVRVRRVLRSYSLN
jgi:hypothetical protein